MVAYFDIIHLPLSVHCKQPNAAKFIQKLYHDNYLKRLYYLTTFPK